MPDRSNFDAMKSGQKNVLNPLIFRTTTAYPILVLFVGCKKLDKIGTVKL